MQATVRFSSRCEILNKFSAWQHTLYWPWDKYATPSFHLWAFNLLDAHCTGTQRSSNSARTSRPCRDHSQYRCIVLDLTPEVVRMPSYGFAVSSSPRESRPVCGTIPRRIPRPAGIRDDLGDIRAFRAPISPSCSSRTIIIRHLFPRSGIARHD